MAAPAANAIYEGFLAQNAFLYLYLGKAEELGIMVEERLLNKTTSSFAGISGPEFGKTPEKFRDPRNRDATSLVYKCFLTIALTTYPWPIIA